MNEVELLRQFRAELPGIRAEKRSAARAALIARIESSTPPPKRPCRGLFPAGRLRLVAAGVGLMALVVALPILLFGGGDAVQPAAAQVLHQVAAVALAQEPQGPPEPGQFLYTRSRDAYISAVAYDPRIERGQCVAPQPCEATDEWSVLVPSEREAWIGPDGSGRVRRVSRATRFVTAGQREAWVKAGRPELPAGGQVEDSGLSGSGFLDTSDLPTEPEALRRLIEARKILGGPPGEAETFVLIGDMLRESYLPPAFRAALYEATAELPGVKLLGEVRDPLGRPGIGVAYANDKRGTREELIFSPETSWLLAEREVVVSPKSGRLEFPPGTETGSATYLESRLVDSIEDRPAR